MVSASVPGHTQDSLGPQGPFLSLGILTFFDTTSDSQNIQRDPAFNLGYPSKNTLNPEWCHLYEKDISQPTELRTVYNGIQASVHTRLAV